MVALPIKTTLQPNLKGVAYTLGTGLALFPIHWSNQPFINYIFLPQIGLALIFASLIVYFADKRNKIMLGNKFIWIPMLVIVASMVLQVAVYRDKNSLATAMFGLSLFGTYLVAYSVSTSGQQEVLKRPILITLGLVTLGGIVTGILAPGTQDGGIITNYCAAVGFLILVGLLASRKWLWIALSPVLISVFLIGALEGLFILAVLGIASLIRRDWSKRTLLPASILLVVVLVWTAIGNIGQTYHSATTNIRALFSLVSGQAFETYGDIDKAVEAATTDRWSVINDALHDIRILGHGYILTANPYLDQKRPVHNALLMIVDQIGPLAGLAWLWICVYCLARTRQKYLWTAVLATSVFDYYVWTQFAPFVWVFAGLSNRTGEMDLIFKEAKVEDNT